MRKDNGLWVFSKVLANGDRAADGTAVIIWPCHGAANQVWSRV